MKKLYQTPLMLTCALLFKGINSNAQQLYVYNNGATIVATANVHIQINGNVINANNGTFDNSGIIHLTGDWTNNAGNTAFINSSPGKVILEGDTQHIQGTDSTLFYKLELAGTGVKYLKNVSAAVEDSLILNDREFAVDSNTIYVLSTDAGIVTRTSGFVSSLKDGGIARATASTNTYLFPVGSSLGTARYRPVEITPSGINPNMYKVRLANTDATLENFDRTNKDSALCQINSNFYHRIYHLSGSDPADLTFYFDTLLDGYYNTIGHWQNIPRWEDISPVSTNYLSSPSLSSITKSSWNNYLYSAFALGLKTPVVNLTKTPNISVCTGDTVELHASPGYSNYDFYVNGNLVQSSSDSILISNNFNNGDIVEVVVNSSGICPGYSNKVTLNVNQKPVANAGSDAGICKGSSIQLSASGGTSFAWSPSTGLSDSSISNPIASPDTTTTYVLMTSNGTCVDYDTLTINVNTPPDVDAGNNTSINLGESTQLNAVSGSNVTYSWTPSNSLSCNDCQSPNANPSETTTYYVTVTDINGCTATDSVTVSVDINCGEVFVPNVFSPNGDNVNDELKVYGNCIDVMNFVIYDRWGNKIFESSNPSQTWDGKYKGKEVTQGIYVYYLKATLINGKEIELKGNVGVVR